MAKRKKYYEVLFGEPEETDTEVIPIRLSNFPIEFLDEWPDLSDEILKIDESGSIDLVSVYYVRKSSKSEMDEFKKGEEYFVSYPKNDFVYYVGGGFG